jgi:hypothetical protein
MRGEPKGASLAHLRKGYIRIRRLGPLVLGNQAFPTTFNVCQVRGITVICKRCGLLQADTGNEREQVV